MSKRAPTTAPGSVNRGVPPPRPARRICESPPRCHPTPSEPLPPLELYSRASCGWRPWYGGTSIETLASNEPVGPTAAAAEEIDASAKPATPTMTRSRPRHRAGRGLLPPRPCRDDAAPPAVRASPPLADEAATWKRRATKRPLPCWPPLTTCSVSGMTPAFVKRDRTRWNGVALTFGAFEQRTRSDHRASSA
jgi:hypothetical protein